MNTQVKSWGNSKAIRLPSALLNQTGLQEDDLLEIHTDGNEIILSRDSSDRSFESRILEYAKRVYPLRDIEIDPSLKNKADAVCREMGMSLQTAVNIFLVKLSLEKRIPFEINVETAGGDSDWKDTSFLYPKGYFDLFGSGEDIGLDDEPEELSFDDDRRIEDL